MIIANDNCLTQGKYTVFNHIICMITLFVKKLYLYIWTNIRMDQVIIHKSFTYF